MQMFKQKQEIFVGLPLYTNANTEFQKEKNQDSSFMSPKSLAGITLQLLITSSSIVEDM